MPVEENLMQAILLTFGTAMVPVLELRGAIPVGVAAGLSPAAACLVSILGKQGVTLHDYATGAEHSPVIPARDMPGPKSVGNGLTFPRNLVGWAELRTALSELADEVAARYEAQGEKVYRIPVGGSNAEGILGYYECAMEITQQAKEMGLEDATIYTGVGSIGTYMGLFCGLKNEGSPLGLVGVAISPFLEAKEKRIMEYFHEVKELYGLHFDAKREDMHIEKDYTRGAYNNPCKEVRDAICYMARREAIILDPCYTGKAFAGICDMIREGKIAKGSKIIFLHTGGLPGIYTKHHRVEFEKELMDGVTIIK